MKRHLLKDLHVWFNRSRRMPLIVRGARQVGKSTLVRLFCKDANLDLIELNLERIKIRTVEQEGSLLSEVLDEIQLKTGKRIQNKSVLFFDEIQEQPSLLKYLRYFYEERPDLAIISAGSLLEIVLRTENFSFPVGRVEFLNLGPMTFTEFLLATNQDLLAEKILNHEFSNTLMDLAQKAFRTYLYVGGMPNAIKAYVQEKSLLAAREVQEQILQTYRADFPKYNNRVSLERIERIFVSSATQIGTKLVYQRLDSESQSKDIRRIVELLIDARVLLPCIHSSASSVPLAGTCDHRIQKNYFLDVGLVNCILKLDLEVLDREMKNLFNTKGLIAEQFVAQHLAYLGKTSAPPALHYWLRDKGSQKGEIDFLIERGMEIIPLEVKSKAPGHLKSLFYFIKEKRTKSALKLSLEPYSVKTVQHKVDNEIISCNLTTLPIWAVESLKNLA